jgi:hypothetical protein
MNYQQNNNALVLYIRTFARSAKTNIYPMYLTKALAIVNERLGIPCCEDPEGIIDYGTMQSNNFTNTVQMLVNATNPTYNRLALENARNLLIQLIKDECCALTNSRYLNNGTGKYVENQTL